MNLSQKTLLTGSSGLLGGKIKLSGSFPNLLTPSRSELDITNQESINKYFFNNKFEVIIHAAALARMSECEKFPHNALDVNTVGTANIVNNVLQQEKRRKKTIRFVYISTDGVYAGVSGGYSENSATLPYNVYGWTKLGGECAVRSLTNHCIIRTRFFDPANIPYESSASDIITSSIEINRLIQIIGKLININFSGIVNVGDKAMSEYTRYKKYKLSLNPCLRADIVKNLNYEIAHDSSMNLSLLKKFVG